MRVEFIHKSHPKNVKYLRQTLSRIVKFTEALDSDANQEILFAECAAEFFSDNPALAMFAGIDENDKVVAHLLASVNDYYGGKFVLIDQCWKNSDVEFNLDGKSGLVDLLKEWGKANGCTDVRTFARNEAVAQILEGYDTGFARSEKVILSTPIE